MLSSPSARSRRDSRPYTSSRFCSLRWMPVCCFTSARSAAKSSSPKLSRRRRKVSIETPSEKLAGSLGLLGNRARGDAAGAQQQLEELVVRVLREAFAQGREQLFPAHGAESGHLWQRVIGEPGEKVADHGELLNEAVVKLQRTHAGGDIFRQHLARHAALERAQTPAQALERTAELDRGSLALAHRKAQQDRSRLRRDLERLATAGRLGSRGAHQVSTLATIDRRRAGSNGFTSQPVAPASLPCCLRSEVDSVVSISNGTKR